MPELPEVEVVRLFLESQLQNKTIQTIEILNPKSFIGHPEFSHPELFKLIQGQKIISFTRRGKQLSLHLSNQLTLLFHLKMTGQLIYLPFSPALSLPNGSKGDKRGISKSTRVIFTFSDHSQLLFNDQRKFGWVKLFTRPKLIEFQEGLGVDILDPLFTPKYFYNQLQKTSRPIKTVLLEQTKFAGIGNIYANDALFLSQIHPLTPSKTISFTQARNLRQHLVQIMTESILHGGSTAKDHGYVKPDGQYGQHQFHFQVYQKTGEPCSVCGTNIERLKLGGRSSFFCPHCQRLK